MTANGSNPPRIGVFLYPSFDSLDVLGPYQVFTIMGSERKLIGPTSPTTSFEGVAINPDLTYDQYLASDEKFDLIFVPGALEPEFPLTWGPLQENAFFRALDKAKKEVTWVTSVCTGALLLAAGGLLDGRRATTHWAYHSILESYKEVEVVEGYRRYVIDERKCPKVVTGGGISSGLDEALAIAALLTSEEKAKSVQLKMQYHPQPPFNCGDPCVADVETLMATKSQMAGMVEATRAAFRKYSNLPT